jgi:hypothetical protein
MCAWRALHARFCTHGMQHSKVAGIHIALTNDSVTPIAAKTLMVIV